MKSLFKIAVKLLDILLDTTPRQWLIFLAETLCLDYRNPERQFREMLFVFRGPIGGALALSLMLHGLLISSTWIKDRFDTVVSGAAGESIDLQEQKSLEKLMALKEAIEVSGVYYLNGTEKKIDLQKATDPKLSMLLQKFKQGLGRWGDASSLGIAKADASVVKNKQDVTKASYSWSETVKNSKSAAPKVDGSALEQGLAKTISSYNPRFQNCYEKSLLKDALMGGRIGFELTVGRAQNISDSKISFEGTASSESVSLLEQCLNGVTQQIRLPANSESLSGKKIKFYVMLKAL